MALSEGLEDVGSLGDGILGLYRTLYGTLYDCVSCTDGIGNKDFYGQTGQSVLAFMFDKLCSRGVKEF